MSRAAAASFARLTHALGCAALIVSATACSHKTTARNYPPPPPATAARPGHPATAASGSGSAAAKNTPPGVVPTISDLYGYASWYGYPYHGRKTASGEVYDMYQMTAAHKTLPLGSLVRVTNQDNGREVEVRINDRGPFVEGRVIDLSYAAAKEIQMVGPGVALVKLSVLETINRPPAPRAPVVLAAAVSSEPATGVLRFKSARSAKKKTPTVSNPIFGIATSRSRSCSRATSSRFSSARKRLKRPRKPWWHCCAGNGSWDRLFCCPRGR